MPEPKRESVFDMETDEAHESRLDTLAEADAAAGRVVPHEDVARWLKSWETADELPCPTSKRQ